MLISDSFEFVQQHGVFCSSVASQQLPLPTEFWMLRAKFWLRQVCVIFLLQRIFNMKLTGFSVRAL